MDAINGLPVATWSLSRASDHHRGFIFIESSDGCDFLAILVIEEHRVARDRTVHRFDASSDDPDASWKNSTIAVRSNRDRGAIEPRSWSVRGGINSTIVRQVFVRICSEIDAQSTHDQATIVVDRGRSRQKAWLGRSRKRGEIKANHEAATSPQGIVPTTYQTASTIAFNWPRSSGQFPL